MCRLRGISGVNVWGCGDRAWGGIVVGADSMGWMASFCTVGFLWSHGNVQHSEQYRGTNISLANKGMWAGARFTMPMRPASKLYWRRCSVTHTHTHRHTNLHTDTYTHKRKLTQHTASQTPPKHKQWPATYRHTLKQSHTHRRRQTFTHRNTFTHPHTSVSHSKWTTRPTHSHSQVKCHTHTRTLTVFMHKETTMHSHQTHACTDKPIHTPTHAHTDARAHRHIHTYKQPPIHSRKEWSPNGHMHAPYKPYNHTLKIKHTHSHTCIHAHPEYLTFEIHRHSPTHTHDMPMLAHPQPNAHIHPCTHAVNHTFIHPHTQLHTQKCMHTQIHTWKHTEEPTHTHLTNFHALPLTYPPINTHTHTLPHANTHATQQTTHSFAHILTLEMQSHRNTYTHAHTQRFTHMHTHAHTRMHTLTHTSAGLHTHMLSLSHTHTDTHTPIYIHRQTHTHTSTHRDQRLHTTISMFNICCICLGEMCFSQFKWYTPWQFYGKFVPSNLHIIWVKIWVILIVNILSVLRD